MENEVSEVVGSTENDASSKGGFNLSMDKVSVSGSEKKVNKEEGEAEAPQQFIWASIEIVSGCKAGDEEYLFWWKRAENEKKAIETDPENVDVLLRKTQTSTLNCIQLLENEASLNFSETSKEFVLNEDNISTLMSSTLRITLFHGEAKDVHVDQKIDTQEIPMSTALIDLEFSKTLDFEHIVPVEEVEGTVENIAPLNTIYSIEVSTLCNNNLTDYIIRGRLLHLSSFSISTIPNEWHVELESGENAQEVCADDNRNKCTFTLEISLDLGDSNPSMPICTLHEGRAALFSSEVACVTTESNNTNEKGPVSRNEECWKVEWNQDVKKFLSKESVIALKELASSCDTEKGLQIKIGRFLRAKKSGSKPTELLDDTWNVSSCFSLSNIVQPGVKTTILSSSLRKGTIPRRDQFEEELASLPASSERRKEIQVILNEYDVILGRVARQAAFLTTSSSKISCVVALNKCLREAQNQSVQQLTISELIPPREEPSKYPSNSASLELKKKIKEFVFNIFKEHDQIFKTTERQLNNEEKRRQLIYHLNTSGFYHNLKENLKLTTTSIVKELFPEAPTGGIDDAQCDYYSKLYIHIMEEVNVCLNSLFSGHYNIEKILIGEKDTEALKSDIEIKLKSLKVKAKEHEANGSWTRATKAYLERISITEEEKNVNTMKKYNAEVYYDYGLYLLQLNNLDDAAECFRQCISINSMHIHSILAYGASLCEVKDFYNAEKILKLAIKQEGRKGKTSAICHALLALYFDLDGKDITGNLTNFELLSARERLQGSDLASRSGVCIYLAKYMDDLNLQSSFKRALELADVFMIKDESLVLTKKERTWHRYLYGKLYFSQGETAKALEKIEEAMEVDENDPDIHYFLGQIYVKEGNSDLSILNLTNAIDLAIQGKDSFHSVYKLNDRLNRLPVYLQLGSLYLQLPQLDDAKTAFLQGCSDVPTASTWLGVGITCMRLGDVDGAEEALAEANTLDNENPEVWAYLALLCLNASPVRQEEAVQSLEQALYHDIKNPTLLRELGNGFIAIDKLDLAKKLLRRSLAIQDSSLTRKYLGDLLSAQNCAEDALREYQATLEKTENLEERCALLDQCAQLLVTLGRSEEAIEYRRIMEHQKPSQQETHPAISAN